MIKKQQQKIKLLAFLAFKQTFLFWKRGSQNKTRQNKTFSELTSSWHNFKSIPSKIRIKIWIITSIISAQHCTEETIQTSKTGRSK